MNARNKQIKNGLKSPAHIHIGELVKVIRTGMGEVLTQAEFAKRVGITRSMITHCESSNTCPSDKVLQNIAKTFAQDSVEYDIFLRKLRRAALYSKDPSAYEDIMTVYDDEEDNIKSSQQTELLPEVLCAVLQDAMHQKNIMSADLAEKIEMDPQHLREVLRGDRRVSTDDLKAICKQTKCNFPDFELVLGRLPQNLKEAVIKNRALVHHLSELEKLCRKKNNTDLLEFLENLQTCMAKLSP